MSLPYQIPMFFHKIKVFLIAFFLLGAPMARAQVTAFFKASDTAGCLPVIVHFSNLSTGATIYSWDMGDGSTPLTSDSVSYAYIAIGNYTVTLTASNGGVNSTYKTVIRVYGQPTVNFFANHTSVCPGAPITFTSTTVPNAWGPITYTWNFGDGGSSSSSSPTYYYLTPGNYNTALYAVNVKGCVSSLIKTPYIQVFTPANVVYSALRPSYCTAPATDTFNNTTTGYGTLSYAWTFGDGASSTKMSPVHTYSLPGTYAAKLTVTDGNGCTDTAIHHANVGVGNLGARFLYSTASTCVDSVIYFTDSSDAHISSKWYFGDGSTDSIENPSHFYAGPGTYTAKHVIYNGKCYDSAAHTITISQPYGSFTAVQTCTAPFNNFVFNASASPGTTITWDFGDHTTGTGNSITHTYSQAGAPIGDIDTVIMAITDPAGCVSVVGKSDTDYNPLLRIIPYPDKGCAPLLIDFSADPVSMINIPHWPLNPVEFPYIHPFISYFWDFGDGSPTTTSPTPSHTYTAVGIYNARCRAVTSNGCILDSIYPIKVGMPITATATRTPSRLCAGQPMYFVNTTASPLVDDWKWEFGDGISGSLSSPKYVYKKPGIYQAEFTVLYRGCAGPPVLFDDTVDAPGADIRYSYTCIPNNGMVFIDSSIGVNTRIWNFGDGTPNTTADSITHFFPNRGTYNVRLTTYNFATGCRDTAIYQTRFLRKPDMRIWTTDITNICKEQTVTMNSAVVVNYANFSQLDTSFYPVNNNVDTTSERSFVWYDNWKAVDRANLSATFTFHTKGYHDISFVIMDSHTCYDTLTLDSFVLVGWPTDSFTFTPTSGCAPLTVNFTDKSTDVPGAAITSYSWSFGDGTKDLTSAPFTSHTYTGDSTYILRGSIKDGFGCIDTFRSHGTVIARKPKADFSASSTYTCVADNVNFSNYSSGSYHWIWSFGDGDTSHAATPNHVYTTPGVYTIQLIAFDAFGCTDTLTDTGYITVNPVPHASFYMDDSFVVCPPLNVHFFNTSSGSSSCFWNFGDGTFSTTTNPANIYSAPKSYRVKLSVDNIYGCTDTAIGHAVVFGYSGAFTYTPLTVCGSSPVHFSAVLTNVTSIVWDFNDGITSGLTLLDTISHKYLYQGRYLPKLILTDSTGCQNFSLGADTIKVDSTVAGFTTNPNPGCMNSPVNFTDTSTSFYSTSASWLWTFGPGATSTIGSPAYTYTVAGTHPVTMQVTSNHGCVATVTENVKVDGLPAAITGPAEVCNGLTISVSDPATGGTWASNNTTIATINSGGVVTGISPGSATITYQLAVGCPQYEVIKVDSLPVPISGITNICAGLSTTLSSASAGGSWTTSNTTIATINASSGSLTGMATGTATVTYKLPTGCITTIPVTINNSPVAITGPGAICTGTTYAFSDGVTGGAWSSSNTAVAIINPVSGDATGVSARVVTITYNLGSGCAASKTITVVTNPSAISGKDNMCAGSMISLSDPTPGGLWSSSNTAVATVAGPGNVSGIAGGPVTISYTIGATCAATMAVTVNSLPVAITGAFHLCTGLPTVLSDATAGGLWSSISPAITLGSLSGNVTGISAGTAIITYALPTGCNVKQTVTVTISPSAITGPDSVCTGQTTTLSDRSGGGAWSSNNTTVATVGAGIVFGRSVGTTTISYVLAGCPAMATVTVDPLPSTITGSNEVCVKDIIMLNDATVGGIWSSLSTTVSVSAGTGVVAGITAGTANITYTSLVGCAVTKNVTVNPLPSAISGPLSACVGLTITLSDVGGGTWSSANSSIGTVTTVTGIVTGVTPGRVQIDYTLATGCFASKLVVVNPLPLAIGGTDHLCAGATTVLSDPTGGGDWSSGNTSVLTFDPGTGIANGITGGTATITYTLATGCIATKIVTVNPMPAVISGPVNVCVGYAILSDLTTGGIWSSGNTTVATIDGGTGLVNGITVGTSAITYTLATGCIATGLININPLPARITGDTTICQAQTTTLSDIAGGGTWSSGNTTIALIGAGSGVLSGIAGGTTAITYTLSTGCNTAITVSVTPLVAAISGTPAVCKGLTTKLSDATPGGTWSSGNSTVAGVDATGLVNGSITGITIITYQSVRACGIASITVTVNPQPDAGTIAGDTKVCAGSDILLTDTATGGVWESGNKSIAGITVAGIVTGYVAGTDSITYSYTNVCGTAKTALLLTVEQMPNNVHIVTHPDTMLCANTLFMNFGADVPEPLGQEYTWSADNGILYAVSENRQYCLISFNTPGASVIKLTTDLKANGCGATDSLLFNINTGVSPEPQVVYYAPEFVCKDNTADNYQWGYDDVRTLDSTLFAGEINQNYHNAFPDLVNRNYWVLTYHHGCLQKSYYNTPTRINNVSSAPNIEILLFPNPADAKINIEVKGVSTQDEIGVKIYNMIGKELKSVSFFGGMGSIALAGMPPAAYMVVFSKNGEKIGARTFIKK
jgi:PKD repeat protein/uncharacterized protein YjdB